MYATLSVASCTMCSSHNFPTMASLTNGQSETVWSTVSVILFEYRYIYNPIVAKQYTLLEHKRRRKGALPADPSSSMAMVHLDSNISKMADTSGAGAEHSEMLRVRRLGSLEVAEEYCNPATNGASRGLFARESGERARETLENSGYYRDVRW